jgi:hypothetical protein
LLIESTPRPGGGRHIHALDVFEVSATATPMNNSTRITATKALDTDPDERVPSLEELRQRERALRLNEDYDDEPSEQEQEALRQAIADEFSAIMRDYASPRHENGTTTPKSLAALKRRADRTELRYDPNRPDSATLRRRADRVAHDHDIATLESALVNDTP